MTLINSTANKLKRVNFYIFHYPPFKEENIINNKKVEFLEILWGREQMNVWIDLKIHRIIMY